MTVDRQSDNATEKCVAISGIALAPAIAPDRNSNNINNNL